MAVNNWFVSVRGFPDRKSEGPLTRGQVLQLVRDGTLGMKSSVAHQVETDNEWVELRKTILASEAQVILDQLEAEAELERTIANDAKQETKRRKQQEQKAARQRRDEDAARQTERAAAANEERRQQEQTRQREQQRAAAKAREARNADIVLSVKSQSIFGTIIAIAFYILGAFVFIVFTLLAIAGNNLSASERGEFFGYGLGSALSMFVIACALQFIKDIRDDSRITRLRADKAEAERTQRPNSS
jgi:flagellar biosynthesis GTPase FlhF